ncbi:riboflavin biosynthesis protein RibF [Amphibacillus sp. Q70]|uniref:riboflavin biosynthesis protein RibF n=1 Tax=Amphibacillus sp. Q70 TaxID=3453416 RepID=UPI003F85090F
MKIVELTYPHDYRPDVDEEAVCAIGFFDGIHKGHQHVLQTAKDTAERLNKKLAVMTFTPHPLEILTNKKSNITYLTTFEQKKNILADFGVDLLYLIHFDLTVAQLEPQTFIDHYIVDLNITQLVCGFDFTYGHRGAGNVHTILNHSKERFGLTVVEKFNEENQKVSSTRIRQLLAEGKVDQAKTLLTRPLMTNGKVIHGHKRGGEMGYPTANLAVDPAQALPRLGVYYVTVDVDGERLHGMASLGYNPTFDDSYDKNKIKIEVHLFDFNNDLYNKSVTVYWEKFIRPEYKFDSVDGLIKQLKQDEREIRHLF